MGQRNSSNKPSSQDPAGTSPGALIASLVSQHPVVIFSKTFCPYCSSAKAAIASSGKSVHGFSGAHVVELNTRADGAAVQAALASATGRRTVPNAFIGGKTVGGGDDVVALARRGQLSQLIAAAVEETAVGAQKAEKESLMEKERAKEKEVDEMISGAPVVVFSKTYCPYCRAAKAAIADVTEGVRGFDGPTVVELDAREDGSAIQEILRKKTGRRTVPNVFIGGKSVGGGDDVVALKTSGALAGLIQDAVGALDTTVATDASTTQATNDAAIDTTTSAAERTIETEKVTDAVTDTGSEAFTKPATEMSAVTVGVPSTDTSSKTETAPGSSMDIGGVETDGQTEATTGGSTEPDVTQGAEASTEASAMPEESMKSAEVAGPSRTPKEIVDALIKEHPVLVFSKTWCPFCAKAKRAIAETGDGIAGFDGAHVVELDELDNGAALQDALEELTGRATVPNVFIGGRSVGGGDDVAGYARDGSLEGMLRGALGLEEAVAETPDSIVDGLVEKHPVLVFSKSWCPYCRAAKAAIAESGERVADFAGARVIELDLRPDGAELQAALARRTGRTTVPNVFIGGVSVGGGDDVVALKNSGVLPQMLRAAPTRLAGGQAPDMAPEAAKDSARKDVTENGDVDVVTLGAGCFWGVELAFQRLEGVVDTEVGYSNGKFSPVSYEAVCSGQSGHAEVVRVWYKPSEVTLDRILDVWDSRHDVTSLNKQGNDRGTQYRSAVFYHTEEQAKVVAAWKAETEKRIGRPVVTDIAPVEGYTRAEHYHQKYLERGGQSAAKGDSTAIRCYG